VDWYFVNSREMVGMLNVRLPPIVEEEEESGRERKRP
jgi:hypothetical protein